MTKFFLIFFILTQNGEVAATLGPVETPFHDTMQACMTEASEQMSEAKAQGVPEENIRAACIDTGLKEDLAKVPHA